MTEMKCRVDGCEESLVDAMAEHHCFICGIHSVDHTYENCPQRCTVYGCTGNHTTPEHFCYVCGKDGVDHTPKNCPEL